MSDPSISAQQPAPGWYPDGSGALRWWDGTQWTAHVQATAGAPATAPVRRRLPDTTPVDNFWAWLIALLSFVTAPMIFLIDMRGYMNSLMTGDPSGIIAYFMTLLLITIVGWGVTAFCIVAAYRDYKRLLSLGVERPFHWAFAFLGTTVYLIGRHVVLRKVLRTPGWPLWAHLIAYGVYLIMVTVWTMWIVQTMIGDAALYGGRLS